MNRYRQRGVTGIGWLVILALIGFFSLLTLKLAPIYMEHFSVMTVLSSLKQEPLITQKTVSEVRSIVQKRLKVNGVYDMARDAIKITKEGGVMTVQIVYEVRKNMAANVDVLVSFSDSVELVSN
ncbi:MAG: DUF4845 domain-containing protein [Gammaproteobacteria bacterium]|nr:DUF4845 domain-containing protein [Gammaproteobacteria bacterium]